MPSLPTILLVDADEPGRAARSRALSRAGFRVVHATGGNEGVALAAAQPPALLLVGPRLADMPPTEACRRMRETTSSRPPPVLRIENHASPDAPVENGEECADACLAEPVGADVLLATVRALLRMRAAEEQLRDARHRLDAILSSASIGTFVWDIGADAAFADESLATMFNIDFALAARGLPAEHFIGLIDPQDQDKVRADLQRTLAAGDSFQHEFRIARAGESPRWMLCRATLERADDGRPLRLSGAVMDISDRKFATAALEESEALLQGSLDALTAHIAILDGRGVILAVNAAWRRFAVANDYRGHPEFGVGHNYLQACTPGTPRPGCIDQGQSAAAGIRAVLEGSAEYFELEYPCHSPEEERFFVMRVTRFGAGEALRAVVSHEDVTERRRSERAVRETNAQFASLANSIPNLAWMARPDGHVYWYNEPWYQYTGTTAEEMRGWGWQAVQDPAHLPRVLERWQHSLDTGEPFDMEFPLRGADGQFRTFLTRARPVRDSGGRIVHWFGTNTDVEDARRAAAILESNRRELEQALAQRSRELTQSHQRLHDAERLAALGTLSAGLGHDMGNLLLPLRVRLDALAQANLSEELRRDVEGIRTSADYLQRLANGLRLLAADPHRVTTGQATELLAWWVDSSLLFRNILPRHVELQHELPGTPLWVAMSRAALTQAVFNLVQNAADALAGRASGVVRITAAAQAGGVTIVVSDNGPGMTDEVRSRCMEPFFTTKPRAISTGMGLSLVYGLVRDAGGSIVIDSEPESGTRFTIQLPAAQPARPVAPPARVAGASLDVADPRLRAMVASELHALGIQVLSGEAARHAAVHIVDQHAPAANGDRRTLVLSDQTLGLRSDAGAAGPRTPRLQAIREALRGFTESLKENP